MRRNFKQGPCAKCGVTVPPNQGELIGPPWQVLCSVHATPPEAVRIVATKESTKVVFDIRGGHLGDRFAAYRKAITGALFDGTRKVNTATLEQAPGMIAALRQAGFVVEVGPDLASTLQAVVSGIKAGMEAASARAEEMDAKLRQRGLHLFPFQKVGVPWLAGRTAGLLADEMGLGKSVQAALAVPDGAPVLVVCPAVAKGVWKREFAKWRPEYKVTSLEGRGNFRWPEPGEVVVTNYDILPTASDEKGHKELLPLRTRDSGIVPRKERMETSRPGDVIRLRKGAGGQRFYVSISVVSTSGAEMTIATLDETSDDGAEVIVPPTFLVKGLDGAKDREYKPAKVLLEWHTTGPVEFGVTLSPMDVGAPPPNTVIIADEGHVLKNSDAQRTTNFRHLSYRNLDASGRVWVLTATPLLNRPQELWGVLQAARLGREAFGGWKQFVEAMGGFQGQWGMEWGTPDTAKVTEALRRVSLRRERVEVLPDLPTKMYETIDVDIDAKAKAALDRLNDVLAKKVFPTAWERLGKPRPLGRMTDPEHDAEVKAARIALRQATEGQVSRGMPGFEEFSKARAALAAAKIPALLEMVEQFEEQEEPLVVFSAHIAPLEAVGKRDGWALITGETDPKVRTQIEDAFQAGKLKGIAASIKAGGVAITLTRSHRAVFVDRELNPALNAQAEDRVCRIGQTRGVIITQLRANHPLDARIEELLGLKSEMIDASVHAARVGEGDVPEQLPDVDYDRLAEEARAEAERVSAIWQAEVEKFKDYAEVQHQVREQILSGEGGCVMQHPEVVRRRPPRSMQDEGASEPRGAVTPREKWAARAVLVLAGLDPDRARAQNDVGFNSADGGTGHWLAGEVLNGLTDKQWELAAALCTKYWRQVGRPPAP